MSAVLTLKRLKSIFLGLFIYCIYWCLKKTWRVTITETNALKSNIQKQQPFILSHWHGDEIALLQLIPKYNIGTVVSSSEDGNIMNVLVRCVGGKTVRGSSTRGGVGALKGLIRLVKSGCNCSFAVDGPKGPIYQIKPGVFEISKLLGLPIFAGGVYCDRRLEFPKSWNKTYLPLPFAKIHICWLDAFSQISKDQDPRDPKLAEDLKLLLMKARNDSAAKSHLL